MNPRTHILIVISALLLTLWSGFSCETGGITSENGEKGPQEAGTAAGTLHEAARWGTAADAQAFLDDGGEVDARDIDGRTPLSHAASSNNDPAVTLALLDAGADIHAADQDALGYTALHWESGAPQHRGVRPSHTPRCWAATHGNAGLILHRP